MPPLGITNLFQTPGLRGLNLQVLIISRCSCPNICNISDCQIVEDKTINNQAHQLFSIKSIAFSGTLKLIGKIIKCGHNDSGNFSAFKLSIRNMDRVRLNRKEFSICKWKLVPQEGKNLHHHLSSCLHFWGYPHFFYVIFILLIFIQCWGCLNSWDCLT